MTPVNKSRLAALGGLVVTILIGVGALWVIPQYTDAGAYNGTQCEQYQRAADATRSLIVQTPSGEKRNELETHLADYIQQARDIECVLELPQPEDETSASSSEATPASTEAPATETPASEPPAQDPSSGAGQEATSQAAAPVDDSWVPRYFVLENDPATPRNFGPAVDPATAVEGFRPRMEADPALLCANGGLIQNGTDGGADCVRALTASKAARDSYLNATFDQIADMHVETREPQQVETAYMVVGEDGIPRVIATSITRTATYHVLVVTTKDGRVYLFRLECGYQWDTGVVIEQAEAPAPAPAQVEDAPSQPYTPAPRCISGGTRDEDARCTPPPGGETPPDSPPPGSTPPGSTPPGSTPPSTPPTTTPPSTPPTTVVTTSNNPKTGYNTAAVSDASESHTVNYNDGATDSQGIQDDPEGDAEEAASSAASSNNAQSSAASSAADEADTDSGQTEPGSNTDVDPITTGGEAPSTGAAGEDTSGGAWGDGG